MQEHHEKQAHEQEHQEQETAPGTAPADSPWRPAPPEGEPGSDRELRISHAPQENQPERPEDVNA
jgi:hypothetical protein